MKHLMYLRKKVKILTKTTSNQVNLIIMFVSKRVLKVQLKDLIPVLNKSWIVNKFNCFCERSYYKQTLSHFNARIKEHLPGCIMKFIEEEPEIKTTATKNTAKRFSTAEDLINLRLC